MRLGVVFLSLTLAAPSLAEEAPRIRFAGAPIVVFDTRKDSCERTDIPDIAARSFRDAHGMIHLFASHSVNRAMIGPSLDRLRHDCRIAFRAAEDERPEAYSDRQWLSSFYTTDGRSVVALLHAEFEGNLRPALCSVRAPGSCWWNAITFARSDDGGASFAAPKAPANLVAAIPYRYQGNRVEPAGYFNPTNIVARDGAFYAMIWATHAGAQALGGCIVRTTNPADPKSWRGWNGVEYAVRFVDPYRDTVTRPEDHVCKPVGVGQAFLPSSLTRERQGGRFLLTEYIQQHASGPEGFYVTSSTDLIDWTEPRLIASEAELAATDEPGSFRYSWPSLLDPAAPDRSFSEVSGHAFLFYIRSDLKRAPYTRLLLRREVTIEP